MRLGSAFKDWRRRRLLQKAGIGVELWLPTFAAGARSGVWVVEPSQLGADAVVYSFGVGDNIAWDLAMIARFGCVVHAFDPTPRAIAWLQRQALPAAFRFQPLGIAAHDGELRLCASRRHNDVNYRPRAAAGGETITVPVQRLRTIASALGHARISVLKLDIEGGEYEVLADLLAHGPLPAQLLVEFHHGQDGIPFARTQQTLAALRGRGYRVFDVSRRGLELSLLRAD